jgi:hypothetical protein
MTTIKQGTFATTKTIAILLLLSGWVLIRPVPAQQTNAGFSSQVVTNQTSVQIGAQVLDQLTGQPRAWQLPPGAMWLVTATNLTTPLAQWVPVGDTNSIANVTLTVPFDAVGDDFYSLVAQPDTNFDQSSFPPYSLKAILSAPMVTKVVGLGWTNSSSNPAGMIDLLLVSDGHGHLYTLKSLITPPGAPNSLWFGLARTNGLSFVRYSIPATNGDYFFLSTNYFQTPDVITVPYIIMRDPSSAPIMQVAAYDMTDPSNPHLLAQTSGDGSDRGTLEIPGMLMSTGTRTLEFQVTDTGYYTTVTDFTVTIQNLVNLVFPVLTIRDIGNGNRVLAGTAGAGIAIQATTSATNGTWVITQYDGPSGAQLQQVQVPVASTGGVLQYNDGGEPPGGYTNAWFDFSVTIGLPDQQTTLLIGRPNFPPSIPPTNRFRVYPTGPHYPAGEITCYDHTALPSNSGDRQYAITAMQTVATMASFTCYPIDFPSGVWTAVNPLVTPPTTSLYEESVWGWDAINASLCKIDYEISMTGTGWTTQTPSFAINNFFINGHGGTNGAGVAIGVQGTADNDQVSQASLAEYGFDTTTNKATGLALAVFASCRIGDGPLMKLVLRNNGVYGQISGTTRAQKSLRWFWGLGWNQDKVQDWQIYDFIAWWAYYSAYLTTGNTFQYSFDAAIQQALNATAGNGGVGAVWTGCQGMTLDKTLP